MNERSKHEIQCHQRVEALAEVHRRFSAIVLNLTAAIGEALPGLDGDSREGLERALLDAEGQVAAADDALGRALADLPEGGADA